MSNVPVCVFNSFSLGEVAIVRSMLQSADIEHYVENELITGYGPIFSQSPAAGGMKVFTRPEDADDAKEIVNSLRER